MAGLWPFKKKSPPRKEAEVITYTKNDTHAEEILSDRSHVEDDQFKAALDLLTKPHLGGEAGGEIIQKTVIDVGEETPDLLQTGVPEGAPAPESTATASSPDEGEFEQSGDGYWYRKKADGSYDPEAYVKQEDGSFTPYS